MKRTWCFGLAAWLTTTATIADPPVGEPPPPALPENSAGPAPLAIPAVRRTLAPDFTLESTTGATRRRRNYAGQVMVIIYEDRDATHQNDVLKAELARRARESDLATRVTLLPVADLHAYDFWPAAGFARSAVQDIAHTLGVEVFMDWSGAMGTAYGFRPGASHVLVVDRDGGVVFRHDGAIAPAQQAMFFAALAAALQGTRQ